MRSTVTPTGELPVCATRDAGPRAIPLTGLTELAPPVLPTTLARALFAKRLFNITITNGPGSPRRL